MSATELQTSSDLVASSNIKNDSEKDKHVEYTDALYMNILKDIRDMNVLSLYQLHYLKEITVDKLIYIIGVYNRIIRNVNELL